VAKQFAHLTATHPLVNELKSGKYEWWNTLVERSHKDPKLNIQVRGDYLSVYWQMGSLLTIRLNENKDVVCSIHYKYLIASQRSEYVDVNSFSNVLAIKQPFCKLVNSILDEENFKRIKLNIARLAGEEKSIQSKLVEKNRNTLLDVEIAFSESGALTSPETDKAARKGTRIDTRIDLVNFDKSLNRLVFIELKQIFDGRLYSDSKGRKEVNRQIEKYKLFAKKHEEEIVKTYNDVIEVKKEFGLLPKGSALWSAKIEGVEPKPILAIAAYNQDIINARRGKVKEDLDTSNLAALYFFGPPIDLNLPRKKDKNKELFPKN
jgi:hypothetical protein